MNRPPAFLFGLLARIEFARHIPKVLAGVQDVDDLNSAGEVIVGDIPDPVCAIPDDNLLLGALPAAIPGFQIDSRSELACRFDGGDISRGVRIANGIAVAVPCCLVKTLPIFASRVCAGSPFTLPARPSFSVFRTGTPVPSIST